MPTEEIPAPRVPPAELFEEKVDEGVGLETYEKGGERIITPADYFMNPDGDDGLD